MGPMHVHEAASGLEQGHPTMAGVSRLESMSSQGKLGSSQFK